MGNLTPYLIMIEALSVRGFVSMPLQAHAFSGIEQVAAIGSGDFTRLQR